MSFGENIIEFFDLLQAPPLALKDVEILWPYSRPEVRRVMHRFYKKFLDGDGRRIFLIGINPGRFGAGVTGICFTDPIRLGADCGIAHSIAGRSELSSDFVYRMISAFGGPRLFFKHYYMTALSPVGFTQSGKNINYYELKGDLAALDEWMVAAMKDQISAGGDRRVAFSMGQGANFKYLQRMNNRHNFFDRIEALPHPRWIMQYKRRQLEEFIRLYIDKLSQFL